MYPLFIYLLKSIIASSVLLLYYFLALRNKKFHSYNRFYLLSTIILSLIVPLVHFNYYPSEGSQLGGPPHFFSFINSTDPGPSSRFNSKLIFYGLEIIISAVLLLVLFA